MAVCDGAFMSQRYSRPSESACILSACAFVHVRGGDPSLSCVEFRWDAEPKRTETDNTPIHPRGRELLICISLYIHEHGSIPIHSSHLSRSNGIALWILNKFSIVSLFNVYSLSFFFYSSYLMIFCWPVCNISGLVGKLPGYFIVFNLKTTELL